MDLNKKKLIVNLLNFEFKNNLNYLLKTAELNLRVP